MFSVTFVINNNIKANINNISNISRFNLYIYNEIQTFYNQHKMPFNKPGTHIRKAIANFFCLLGANVFNRTSRDSLGTLKTGSNSVRGCGTETGCFGGAIGSMT